jgi:hypothetical protein
VVCGVLASCLFLESGSVFFCFFLCSVGIRKFTFTCLVM